MEQYSTFGYMQSIATGGNHERTSLIVQLRHFYVTIHVQYQPPAIRQGTSSQLIDLQNARDRLYPASYAVAPHESLSIGMSLTKSPDCLSIRWPKHHVLKGPAPKKALRCTEIHAQKAPSPTKAHVTHVITTISGRKCTRMKPKACGPDTRHTGINVDLPTSTDLASKRWPTS